MNAGGRTNYTRCRCAYRALSQHQKYARQPSYKNLLLALCFCIVMHSVDWRARRFFRVIAVVLQAWQMECHLGNSRVIHLLPHAPCNNNNSEKQKARCLILRSNPGAFENIPSREFPGRTGIFLVHGKYVCESLSTNTLIEPFVVHRTTGYTSK